MVERKIAVVGKEECYRNTRRYISLTRLDSRQREAVETEVTGGIGVQRKSHVLKVK